MTRNFIEAKERYLSVIEELSHIADIIKQAERNGSDIQFDRKIFMCQFDSLLQYSLLEYAINDDYLDYDELTFIKDITKYADFISYINSHYENSITWDDIYHANETSSGIGYCEIGYTWTISKNNSHYHLLLSMD